MKQAQEVKFSDKMQKQNQLTLYLNFSIVKYVTSQN